MNLAKDHHVIKNTKTKLLATYLNGLAIALPDVGWLAPMSGVGYAGRMLAD